MSPADALAHFTEKHFDVAYEMLVDAGSVDDPTFKISVDPIK